MGRMAWLDRTASRFSLGSGLSRARRRRAAISGYLVWRLAETRLGRAMRAVRDNELAASAAGIDVFRTKVIAFALGSLLGGLGGGLFAGGFPDISPDQFASPIRSSS